MSNLFFKKIIFFLKKLNNRKLSLGAHLDPNTIYNNSTLTSNFRNFRKNNISSSQPSSTTKKPFAEFIANYRKEQQDKTSASENETMSFLFKQTASNSAYFITPTCSFSNRNNNILASHPSSTSKIPFAEFMANFRKEQSHQQVILSDSEHTMTHQQQVKLHKLTPLNKLQTQLHMILMLMHQ